MAECNSSLSAEDKSAFLDALSSRVEAGDLEGCPDHLLQPTEPTIGRYMRARKGQVDKAIELYVNMAVWYRDYPVDGITGPDADEDVYEAFCPHVNHKFDKEGRPIYIERTGQIDLPKVLKYLTPETLVRRHVRQQELAVARMKESSQRLSMPVTQQIVILDLKGLSLKPNSAGMSIFKQCIKIDQDYYPETLHKFFLINAPWIFQPMWALIRPWLDPVTRAKFVVKGSSFQDALLEHIDADSLPEEYGGTCQCPGGCIPVLKGVDPRP